MVDSSSDAEQAAQDAAAQAAQDAAEQAAQDAADAAAVAATATYAETASTAAAEAAAQEAQAAAEASAQMNYTFDRMANPSVAKPMMDRMLSGNPNYGAYDLPKLTMQALNAAVNGNQHALKAIVTMKAFGDVVQAIASSNPNYTQGAIRLYKQLFPNWQSPLTKAISAAVSPQPITTAPSGMVQSAIDSAVQEAQQSVEIVEQGIPDPVAAAEAAAQEASAIYTRTATEMATDAATAAAQEASATAIEEQRIARTIAEHTSWAKGGPGLLEAQSAARAAVENVEQDILDMIRAWAVTPDGRIVKGKFIITAAGIPARAVRADGTFGTFNLRRVRG